MNKTDFAARLAVANGIAESQAREMVNTVFAALVDALVDEQRVSIRGFGAFEVREHKAKSGRNPRTGERIMLSPRRTVVYTSSPRLRKALGETNS